MIFWNQIRFLLCLIRARWFVFRHRRKAPRGFDPVASDIAQAYSQTSWGKDALDDPLLIDGMTDFSGGQQSFLRSTIIPPNAYQLGVNGWVRDNYEFRTRPGADRIVGGALPGIPVNLPANYAAYAATVNLTANTSYVLMVGANEVNINMTNVASVVPAPSPFIGGSGTSAQMLGIGQSIQFTTGNAAAVLTLQITAPSSATAAVTATLFQVSNVQIQNSTCLGLYYYDTPNYEQLLAAFNGNLWIYQGGAWAVSLYAPAPNRLAWEQGIDQLLISDGQNPMEIYDGQNFNPTTTVGSPGPGPNDPPQGATILCFHQGCMFAAGIPPINASNQYPGTGIFSDTVMVSNSLAFGTGAWNNTTRSFRVGSGDGEAVVAMASIQDQVLCCFKQDSVWLVNTGSTPNPSQFAANNAVASLSQGIGIVGRDAWCAYGNDLLFMAQDGIRSVQRMQAAAGQWQLTAPLSLPIQDVIMTINWQYAFLICAKKYQEFAFFFVPTGSSTVNNTVIVYNGRINCFVGTFTNWNGQAVEITRFSGINRLVFGDTQYSVNMFKDYADGTTDSTYLDNGVSFPCQLSTRSFQHNDFVLDKQPDHAIIRFSAGNSNVEVQWYGDLVLNQTWTVNPLPKGSILGVTTILPFQLSSVGPTVWKKSLRASKSENEGYFSLSSTSGWWWLRQVWCEAFAQPPKETFSNN